jgi:hypothetical protein
MERELVPTTASWCNPKEELFEYEANLYRELEGVFRETEDLTDDFLGPHDRELCPPDHPSWARLAALHARRTEILLELDLRRVAEDPSGFTTIRRDLVDALLSASKPKTTDSPK